ncbi:MAG: carbohydrate ABC transporter permease [Elusimicrobiota bacterium]
MREKRRKSFAAYFYLTPGLFFLTIFIILPVLSLFVLSFFKWDIFSGGQITFTGFENYIRLFKDPGFYNALKNTFLYVLGTVPAGMAGGLLLAVLINNRTRGNTFYRTCLFLPFIVSLAATGIVWLWLYDYQGGILNHFLLQGGLDKVNWLGDPDLALGSIIGVTLWRRIGYNMVIFLAGLQIIPGQLYAAAKIDGAGALAQFKYITWPHLLPTASFVLIINLIFAFRDFSQIYIMTGGGPMGRTTTLVYYIYEMAFQESNICYGAAISTVLFLIVITITWVKVKYFSPEENK